VLVSLQFGPLQGQLVNITVLISHLKVNLTANECNTPPELCQRVLESIHERLLYVTFSDTLHQSKMLEKPAGP
jgi:hypothetical protein